MGERKIEIYNRNKRHNPKRTFQLIYSTPLFLIILTSPIVFISSLFKELPVQQVASIYLSDCKIYMTEVIVNPQNISRIELANEYWGKDFQLMYPNSVYKIAATDKRIRTKNPTTNFVKARDIYSLQPYQKIVFSFIDSLHDFINSKMDWYIRTTEDCFVDVKKLEKFIHKLESIYNTNTDVVFLGQLCVIEDDYVYIHGGSGWIVSKRAAFIITEKEQKVVEDFLSEDRGDDLITDTIRKILNIPINEMNSFEFLGTPLDNFSTKILMTGFFDQLPKCENRTRDFEKQLRPLGDVVFFHSGRPDMEIMPLGSKIMSSVPENVYVDIHRFKSTLCLK